MRFVVLVLLQCLILNRVMLGGYINPMLYVLFIILLPMDTPKWLVLLLGLFTGLSIDMFTDTLGMHAAACVAMAYCRSYLLEIIAPREGYENEQSFSIYSINPTWFLTYSGILIFVHHLVLFYIEAFNFDEFFSTLFRVILSSIATLAVIVLSQFLLHVVDKKR